jgi:hypothetical protein
MRKSILTLLGVILATASVMAAAFVDDDRAIKYEQLPAKARNFVATHFPNEQPSYTFKEKDFANTEYKLVLESGVRIEFDGTGEWNDVECRGGVVPAAIVPAKIADYVAKKYPSSNIVEISKDHNDWEVRLSGGLELTFDRNYRLVDVDD